MVLMWAIAGRPHADAKTNIKYQLLWCDTLPLLKMTYKPDVEEGSVASLTTTQQLQASEGNKCLNLWYYMFGEQVGGFENHLVNN